ncbi:hypothetical protein ACFVVB_34525 [Streptomyces californicus]|uniref:hypothetical protein n=1 Tax=Streptomyces californicus TaxID=67351 RepID=UPI0036DB5DB1
MSDTPPYSREHLDRSADAVAVMGQAAHDYGPGSPEALGAAAALETIWSQTDTDR